MRCTYCNFPLSPARTTCPRCGMFIAEGTRPDPSISRAPHTPAQGARPFVSQNFKRKRQQSKTTRIGFSLAGLCIFTACLILAFVYFMAQGLQPQTLRTSSPQAVVDPTTASTRAMSASPTALPDPTATVAPTATISAGQGTILQAQMASAVNTSNAQPLQLTTTFKVHQQIYITFAVNSNGSSGAVCLLWYLNGSQFANYPFAVNTSAVSSAYAYTYANSPGSGYVEIYWESTPSCSDPTKVLGQRANFTVTP